jgi:excisionase family DNA binding protein
MQKELYSVNEVAQLLGLHVKTVRKYVRDGRLKSTRIGKQYRIARADLENFTGSPVTGTIKAPRTLEVSSTAQIDDINPDDAGRITNALIGASRGRHEGQPLRVDALYYEDRNRLKVFISGDVDDTTSMLKMVEFLAGEV